MATAVVPGQPGDALTFTLHNVASRFATASFTCDIRVPSSVQLVHEGDTRWANYFKVALQGLQPHLPRDALEKGTGHIYVLVDGSVPPESSLSSSAAMTTCSSIVILTALGAREHISRKEMAEVAIESERLVGVNSGGMDQSVSVFGVPDHAIYVSFVPSLHTEPIRLPGGGDEAFAFVVSNTLVASDKKVMGPVQYNLRVVETRVAARVLEQALGVDANLAHLRPSYRNTLRAVADAYYAKDGAWEAMLRHADVKDAYDAYGKEAAQLQGMLRLVDQHLPQEGVTRAQVEEATKLSGQAFHDTFLAAFPVRADQFFLHKRAAHVYSEAQRVIQFRALCDGANAAPATDANGVYTQLGALMNASHESLRTLYDCSCSELNAVVDIARAHGSLGSRLTGAGWGGCAVHLVPRTKLADVLAALEKEYFHTKFPALSDAQLADALFATDPAQGACVWTA